MEGFDVPPKAVDIELCPMKSVEQPHNSHKIALEWSGLHKDWMTGSLVSLLDLCVSLPDRECYSFSFGEMFLSTFWVDHLLLETQNLVIGAHTNSLLSARVHHRVHSFAFKVSSLKI